MKLPAKLRVKHWLAIGVLAVAVLGGGYYVARYQAWPAVKAWRIARMNREARAYLAQGDLSNALLTARKSLQSSTQNPDGWRVAAATAAARNETNAVWYQDSLCRDEPTKGNYFELIRLCLRFDVAEYALAAVKHLTPLADNDPEFHRLAAQVYRRSGQLKQSRLHLERLTQLAPADHAAELDLAEIDFAATPGRRDPALRAKVLALADQPDLRGRALTLLLRDNLSRPESADTADLVRRLQLTPELDLPARLLIVQGLSRLGQPEAEPSLAQLQVEVATNPADVTRVIDFLVRNGRSKEIQPWVATLPPATRQDENVQRAVAETLLALRDAPGLVAALRDTTWPKNDFLREAMLAYAYRAQGRSSDFEGAWKRALLGVGSDLRKTSGLLARVDEWRWVPERHEVVWKLFTLVPTNESVQDILLRWERSQGNTANLKKLFTRIVEVRPTNIAQNNLAYTSLLLDSNVARASQVAKTLAQALPQNPYYATTYALALYMQGHFAEALARLEALRPSQRVEPVRMMYEARCLAALGQAGAASDLINGVVTADLLPEEKRFVEEVYGTIARLDRTQGNRSRLMAFHQGQETASSASGWLALVAPGVRTSATSDMQLADSFYAASDWTGLGDLLRATDWKSDDYLRSALQAYVLRRQSALSQSDQAWRQAVAVADRNLARLQNLHALVSEWKWPGERLETLNLIFERNPGDVRVLAQLLHQYRETRRTADLQRVLSRYVGENTDTTDESVVLAYYNLLLDTNVARSLVAARNAFEVTPADPVRRAVYAFSLSKQRRAAEAVPVLAGLPAGATSDLVSIPLLRAVIQAQVGARDEARASLAQFNAASALPEESALAAKISKELSEQAAAAKPLAK